MAKVDSTLRYADMYKGMSEALDAGLLREYSKSSMAQKVGLGASTRSSIRKQTQRLLDEGEEANKKLYEGLFERFESAKLDKSDGFKDLVNQQQQQQPEEDEGFELNISADLYGKKGSESGNVSSQSYYNEPLKVEGFTRNAGGAPLEFQKKAIKTIIDVGRSLDATEEEIAMSLAIARHESGFNIYAAAKSTSAYGLGQFIDSTGKGYGLDSNNRDDLGMQAQALVQHTMDNFQRAEDRNRGLEYVYKYHHDGPTEDYGGLSIGKKNVMPYYKKYLKLVKDYN